MVTLLNATIIAASSASTSSSGNVTTREGVAMFLAFNAVFLLVFLIASCFYLHKRYIQKDKWLILAANSEDTWLGYCADRSFAGFFLLSDAIIIFCTLIMYLSEFIASFI
jgi:hypothetical protein